MADSVLDYTPLLRQGWPQLFAAATAGESKTMETTLKALHNVWKTLVRGQQSARQAELKRRGLSKRAEAKAEEAEVALVQSAADAQANAAGAEIAVKCLPAA